MIFNESAAIRLKPVVAPRDMGAYVPVNVSHTAVSADITAAMERISESVQLITEDWRQPTGWPTLVRFSFWGTVDNTDLGKRIGSSFVGENIGLTQSDGPEWGGLYPVLGHGTIITAASLRNQGTITHEYGHGVDMSIGKELGRTSFGTFYEVPFRTLMAEIWPKLQATSSFLYGATNYREWFAEAFTVQHVPNFQGASPGSARLFYALCGSDNDLAGAMRAWFKTWFPDMPIFNWYTLSSGSNFWGAYGGVPNIVGHRLTEMTTGTAINHHLWTEGAQDVSWSLIAGALPAGISMTPAPGPPVSLMLTGTPTTPGDYTFTLRAANSAGNADRTFTGTVFDGTVSVAEITGVTPEYIIMGNNTLLAEAIGAGPITFSEDIANPLPGSIDIDADGNMSGFVSSGIPLGQDRGEATFGVRATNPGGHAHRLFTVPLVQAAGYNGTPAPIPDKQVNVPMQHDVNCVGTNPITISVVSGSMPPGVTPTFSDQSGTFFRLRFLGTPTTVGTYNPTVRVANDWGHQDYPFTFNIVP